MCVCVRARREISKNAIKLPEVCYFIRDEQIHIYIYNKCIYVYIHMYKYIYHFIKYIYKYIPIDKYIHIKQLKTMVKQDASALRFQNKDDFKQQKVQEKCMNHHDYVPIKEIILNWGTSEGQSDIQRNQHKYGQLRRRITSYEGFRQTMLGYDYLSQNTFIKQGQQKGIGHRIGSGKESDVYIVQGTNNKEQVLKIHRLGRICFRKVRLLRDYTNNNYRSSYIKQAKIAALREYVYLKVLQRLGYSVPIVYSCNRHCVQMSYIPGRTLYHVQINQPEIIGKKLLQLAIKLLSDGIVHGDLNEFNVMITPKQDTYLIDFPQVVMSSHAQANVSFIIYTYYIYDINYNLRIYIYIGYVYT